MSSPRLRGPFAANNNRCNKKPHDPSNGKETRRFRDSHHHHIAYNTRLVLLRSNHFPRESELEFQLSSSEHSRPPSLPRRTSLSPVWLRPSLNWFHIGAWLRSPTTLLHSSSSHPKPPPQLPSVVVGGRVGRRGENGRYDDSSRMSPQNVHHKTPLLTQPQPQHLINLHLQSTSTQSPGHSNTSPSTAIDYPSILYSIQGKLGIQR